MYFVGCCLLLSLSLLFECVAVAWVLRCSFALEDGA